MGPPKLGDIAQEVERVSHQASLRWRAGRECGCRPRRRRKAKACGCTWRRHGRVPRGKRRDDLASMSYCRLRGRVRMAADMPDAGAEPSAGKQVGLARMSASRGKESGTITATGSKAIEDELGPV